MAQPCLACLAFVAGSTTGRIQEQTFPLFSCFPRLPDDVAVEVTAGLTRHISLKCVLQVCRRGYAAYKRDCVNGNLSASVTFCTGLDNDREKWIYRRTEHDAGSHTRENIQQQSHDGFDECLLNA